MIAKKILNYCYKNIYTKPYVALDPKILNFEEKPLHVPELKEVQHVLQSALTKSFEQATVEITECPNLTAPQYGLVAAGLCGRPTLLEAGGIPYVVPVVKEDRLYNVKEIVQHAMGEGKPLMAVGAAAGPYPLFNTNCEGIYNISVAADGTYKNESYIAKVSGPEEKCELHRIPENELRCALMLSLYLSHGQPGKVLKITAKKRTGEVNFVETLRQALDDTYQDKVVGMGGLFILKNGNIEQHVMRDFPNAPLTNKPQIKNWMRYYEMPAPINAVGLIITKDHGLDLRLTHFHSFSKSNWGGHYHDETTPETVEYEAYFNIAERIVRIDKPSEKRPTYTYI